MRRGVSGMRRLAAVLSVSTVMLFVAGTGVGQAATLPELSNYSAVGTGQVLNLHLQLPTALNTVLQAAGLSNVIDETVSFSRSIGEVARAGNVGTGLGQMFDGTLNPVLESVTKATLGKLLPKAFASLGDVAQHDSLAEINIPDTPGVPSIIHVGVSEVNAVSNLHTVIRNLKAVVSHSDSKLVGLKIDLGQAIVSQLTSLLQPVLNVTDKAGGLIDTINSGLQTVSQTISSTLGIDVNLTLPKVEQLLSQPLASVGVIETASDTGFAGAARVAKGVTRMADVDLLGAGDSALVHIDSLSTTTEAAIDGTKGGSSSSAVTKIVGLKILGNAIDLTKDALTINGKSFALPIDTVLTPLTTLLKDTLGLNIELFKATHSATATHATAEANTLKISLTPLNGALGLSLGLTGPGSMADVQGSPVKAFTACTAHCLPTTGVPTTMYYVLGATLLGATLLVRRFKFSA